MIKVYLVKEGEHIDEVCLGHAHKDLINGYARANIDCDNGYFLTDSELEQLKGEYFEAGRDTEKGYECGSIYSFTTFEDYEASKKDSHE